jgi:hypothetical protein
MNGCHVGIAQSGGRLDQRVKHGLQIESRTAYDLKHVGGGCLLLQRFCEIGGALAQLVEQSGVFDGDDCLLAKFWINSICLSVNGRTSWR